MSETPKEVIDQVQIIATDVESLIGRATKASDAMFGCGRVDCGSDLADAAVSLRYALEKVQGVLE